MSGTQRLSLRFVGFWVPASTDPMRCWVPFFLFGSLFLGLAPSISRTIIWMVLSPVVACSLEGVSQVDNFTGS